MVFKLPYLEKEYDQSTNQVNKTEKSIKVAIDTSVLAEERWEQHFPKQAERETLFQYMERVKKLYEDSEKADSEKGYLLSMLKAVYCVFDGDELPAYLSFIRLFDLAEPEMLKKQLDIILKVVKATINSSVGTPKNL